MKFLFLLLFTLLFNSSFAGTEINNGGSGIRINGKVATFYSIEMQIIPEPFVPQMFHIDMFIYNLPIPAYAKYELGLSISPSSERKYYAVDRDAIDEKTLLRIKNEYSKITNFSVESIAVFALTDPETKVTLLLPDFFELKDIEKLAILLHESLWINNHVENYSDMLKIERSAQILAYNPEDCRTLYNFINDLEIIFGEKLWALNAAYQCESSAYTKYSRGEPVKVKDYFDERTIETISKIILSSTFKLPYENLISDLTRNLEEDKRLNIFKISKTSLIKKLKSGVEIKAPIISSKKYFFVETDEYIINTLDKENPLSVKNVKKIKELLLMSTFQSTKALDLDSFNLEFSHVTNFIIKGLPTYDR